MVGSETRSVSCLVCSTLGENQNQGNLSAREEAGQGGAGVLNLNKINSLFPFIPRVCRSGVRDGVLNTSTNRGAVCCVVLHLDPAGPL